MSLRNGSDDGVDLGADPVIRRARQRLRAERALVRFVVARQIVSFDRLERFFDLADAADPVAAVLRDDGVFPEHIDGHYGVLEVIESALRRSPEPAASAPATGVEGSAKLASLLGGHEASTRGTEQVPSLLQQVGDRQGLFLRVARASDDPTQLWLALQAILDDPEPTH